MMMLAHNRAQKRKLRNTTGGEKMKTAKRIADGWMIALVAMAIVGMTVGSARAETIYFDDFSGDAGTDLHGTTPDITTGGATWTAGSKFKADGSFTSGDTMTLPFVPVAGVVYTLDCSISSMPSGSWNKFGFNPTTFWHGAYLLRSSGDLHAKHTVHGGGGLGQPWNRRTGRWT